MAEDLTSTLSPKSPHQQAVEAFMDRAHQVVPISPYVPPAAVRRLRARLILEEALETIEALGVAVYTNEGSRIRGREFSKASQLHFEASKPFDLIETVDGCCGIAVVTTGTLSACGVADLMPQYEVNFNNLTKTTGDYKIDEGGKLIKPPNHPKPNLKPILELQGALPELLG